MPKAAWQAQDSVYSFQQWKLLMPLLLSPLPPSEMLGWCPFPYPVVLWPASYLPCLPGLIFTAGSRNPRLCLIAKPLGISLCKQCLKKRLGLGRQVAFFSFKKPSVQIIPISQKAISAFKTEGKSHVLYRPKHEYWILSHMQIILSPGSKSISKHVPINTH